VSRISKPADLVANIPKRPLAPSVRMRGGWKSGRQALELLASSSDGSTEAALLAQGFKPDTLAILVRAGTQFDAAIAAPVSEATLWIEW
jgi:hypothetical protein